MAEFLHLLKRAGLNEYESKAYGALLDLDSATAAEVSKKAAIPRARVYDVLVALEQKGFLAQEPSRPIRFKSFHPETAFANLAKAKKQEFAKELGVLSELKSVLSEHANSIKKREQSESQAETAFLIQGSANIQAKMQELLKNAKEQSIICTNEQNAMKKAGVLSKIVKENKVSAPVVFCSPSTINLSRQFPELSFVDFQRTEKKARFMVFDEKTTLLFLNQEPRENEKALLIESPAVAHYLKETIK